MARLDDFLREMHRRGASDLHLTSNFPPYIRIDGDMTPMVGFPVLTPDLAEEIIHEITPATNRREFEDIWDTDFAYALDGIGRFRANLFRDRQGLGAVFRLIPSKVPTFEELNLPKALRDFCFLTKGLVLVTGPTGSGKSTTLAAMIEFINRNRSEHIITIEDPIEFVYEPKRCLINQREVHSHTKSFENALRAALREDPDIVLVGELRDLKTMEIAIETSETGHLVFGTLHTNTAASTVDRVIDKYPTDQQNQIRAMLASSLKGVVAQTLLKRKGRGRVAAFEVMVGNTAVAANIRDGKTHMIPSAMQVGKGQGMCLFNDSLFDLASSGQVEPIEAYKKSVDKDTLVKKFETHGITLDLSALEAEARVERPIEAATTADFEATYRSLLDTLQREPDNLEVLNNLAWIYSTSASPRFRNGTEAVRLAERARVLAGADNAAILDTLSTAYAEVGQFDMALAAARRALELAGQHHDPVLIHQLTRAIELYQQGQPVRVT